MLPLSQTSRIHALDNLRAVLMWLGIVLHVCVNHLTGPSPLPWKDPQTSPLADFLMVLIHAFRMPAFFMLAAYLAAMMVDTRGLGAMVRNRVRRIALPFAIFWPILFILTILLVLVYAHLMARGSIGFDLAVVPKMPSGHAPIATMHMWFLYYLFWFCMLAAGACAIERHLPSALTRAWRALWNTLTARWWGLLVLAIPLSIIGAGYRAGVLAPNGSFIPNTNELIHNGLFFAFGWTLYRQRATVLPHLAAHHMKYLVAGTVTFIVTLGLFRVFIQQPGTVAHIEAQIAYIYGLTSWLWSVGLIGLFLRHLDYQNRVLRYVSDSSYWVFLVHMLGTLGFGILLFNAPWAASAKIALNVLATTAVCLASYHLLVRRSWIGRLLNGQKTAPTIAIESPDQPQVVALIGELDAYQDSLYPPESRHALDLESLKQSNVLFAVARDAAGQAIGCAAVVLGPDFGELKRMYVSPRGRGQGVARKLLDLLEAQATARGCTVLTLETGPYQEEALALYASAGYARRGPFGNYQPDPLSVFMQKMIAST